MTILRWVLGLLWTSLWVGAVGLVWQRRADAFEPEWDLLMSGVLGAMVVIPVFVVYAVFVLLVWAAILVGIVSLGRD